MTGVELSPKGGSGGDQIVFHLQLATSLSARRGAGDHLYFDTLSPESLSDLWTLF